jgi:hypothetical protein
VPASSGALFQAVLGTLLAVEYTHCSPRRLQLPPAAGQ